MLTFIYSKTSEHWGLAICPLYRDCPLFRGFLLNLLKSPLNPMKFIIIIYLHIYFISLSASF